MMRFRLDMFASLYAFGAAVALSVLGWSRWHWPVDAVALVLIGCATAGILFFPRTASNTRASRR
jgi:hypothetical protein